MDNNCAVVSVIMSSQSAWKYYESTMGNSMINLQQTSLQGDSIIFCFIKCWHVLMLETETALEEKELDLDSEVICTCHIHLEAKKYLRQQ